MEDTSIFWINRWDDNTSKKHYEVICNVDYSDDEGIKTLVELTEVLRTSVGKMAELLQQEMLKKGVVPVTNVKTGEHLLTEITQKLKDMSPTEARQFIKDMHGILVKGK
jgi:hypothetical protein